MKPQTFFLLKFQGDAEVRRDVQAQVVSCVGAAFGNKPTLSVVVEGVSGLDAAKTELLVSLHERSATGAVHRAPASDLAAFLWQQQVGVASATDLYRVSFVSFFFVWSFYVFLFANTGRTGFESSFGGEILFFFWQQQVGVASTTELYRVCFVCLFFFWSFYFRRRNPFSFWQQQVGVASAAFSATGYRVLPSCFF